MELSAEEQVICDKMTKRGYKYIAQFKTIDGDFGEPFYFKSCAEIGPFMRDFRGYENVRLSWSKPIWDAVKAKELGEANEGRIS